MCFRSEISILRTDKHPLSVAQVIQKLRRRCGTRHEQIVTGTDAGNVQQMALSVVHVLKVGLAGDSLNPFLERDRGQ